MINIWLPQKPWPREKQLLKSRETVREFPSNGNALGRANRQKKLENAVKIFMYIDSTWLTMIPYDKFSQQKKLPIQNA